MHKIKKGIKKKIKGKKEKNQEIFTPEEYERYKKQKEEQSKLHQEQEPQEGQAEEQPEEVDENNQSAATLEEPVAEASSTGTTEKEDWRNFLSTTDTVLKETSENLEHIKESSYFQVKKAEETAKEVKVPADSPAVSSTSPAPQPTAALTSKRWVDLDKGGVDDALNVDQDEEEETNEEVVQEEEVEVKKVDLQNIVLKPITDLPIVDAEDYVDVFETTYVDTVESGEVQLYQIPDSPTLDDLNEPDPFDTSNVDEVLHIKKEEPKEVKQPLGQPPKKKKKNLVNLGCAVDVLTGKSVVEDNSQKEVNLLAEFEENEKDQEKKDSSDDKEIVEGKGEEEEDKCVLDSLLFGEEFDGADTVAPLQLQPVSDTKENKKELENENEVNSNIKNTLTDDLAEFLDPLASNEDSTSNKKESHLKDLVAEFDVIDKPEAAPKPLVIKSDAIDDNIKDEFDAEFAVLAATSIAKEKDKAIDELGALDEDDPFDTSSVIKVLGETDAQDSQINQEDSDPFDVDFANQHIIREPKANKPSRPQPPRPEPPKVKDLNFVDEDPFDTSVANAIVPSDPFEVIEDQLSLPETLKPQTGQQKLEDSDAFDPFDTSVADSFGKTELKVLEGQLLGDISDKNNLEVDSDFDFDPRGEDTKHLPTLRPPSTACLLNTRDENPELPVLAPQTAVAETDFDPFDTSIAEKIHIKSLEDELLSDSPKETLNVVNKSKPPPRPASPSCLLSSVQSTATFDPFDTSIADPFDTSVAKGIADSQNNSSNKLCLKLKPPRPASPVCLLATTPLDENPTLLPIAQNSEASKEEFDPFDTSIADQFGKTELKVLESELLAQTQNENNIDNDFNPRQKPIKPAKPPHPVSPACLLTSSPGDVTQNLPPLSPIAADEFPALKEIDPFDTSIANQLGKTEIEGLENQLLGDTGKATDVPSTTVGKVLTEAPQRPAPPTHCVFATTPTDSNPSLKPLSAEFNNKKATAIEDIDPFDTSIADKFGKTELKSLEETLLSEDHSTEPKKDIVAQLQTNLNVETKDSFFDISPSAENIPVLRPTVDSIPSNQEVLEVDPFDTSIAGKFGLVELKVLESQLLVDSGTKRNLSDDDDFDPRQQDLIASKRKPLSAEDSQNIFDSEEELPAQSLPVLQANNIVPSSTEIEVDPFDTTFAENIGPGKQELKLLDKELLGND